MPAPLILVLAIAVAALGATAPPRRGFVVLVAATLLVPSALVVPNGFSPYPTFIRVVMLGVAAGLLRQVRSGKLSKRVLAVTPVHGAFLAFLVIAFLFGMALAPGVTAPPLMKWVDLADQLLFFAVCLACIRAVDDSGWVVRVVAGAAVVSAAIAVVEHFTGGSWARWVFSQLPAQQSAPGAGGLVHRGDQPRVQAAAEYAISFAWVCSALLAVVLAALVQLRRWSAVVAPGAVGLVIAAIYWSISRTAALSLATVGLVSWLATRHRGVGVLVVATAGAAGLAFFLSPALAEPHEAGFDPGGARDYRAQILPVALEAAAEQPITGLGLGALHAYGFEETDNGYLHIYAELGVVGLAALGVLLATVVACVAPGIGAVREDDRLAAGTALAGVTVMIVGGFVFDEFGVLGAARVLWLLAAIGLVAAERTVGGPLQPAPLTVARITAGLLAVGLGVVASISAPVHHATTAVFTTLPADREGALYDPVTAGRTLVRTSCGVIDARQSDWPGTRVVCEDQFRGAGVGQVRIEARTPARVRATLQAITRAVRDDSGIYGFNLTPRAVRAGRATGLRTAPVWIAVSALGAVIFLPRRTGPAARHGRRGSTWLPVATGRHGPATGVRA